MTLDVSTTTTLRIPGVLEMVVDQEKTFVGTKEYSTGLLLTSLESVCDHLRTALNVQRTRSGYCVPSSKSASSDPPLGLSPRQAGLVDAGMVYALPRDLITR